MKFTFLHLTVLALLASCCCKPTKEYYYINPSPELTTYFGVYNTLGYQCIYQNKNKTITDTFTVVKIIDTTKLSIARGGVPCPSDGYSYQQEKGFEIRSNHFGEITGNYLVNNDAINIQSQNSSLGYFAREKGVFTATLIDSVQLNKQIYNNQILIDNKDSNADYHFYISPNIGIIGWVENEKNDTFNLVKYY